MADNPPDELVETQRALDAVMRECEELANALPSWRAVHAGEAEPDPDGEAALAAARAERSRLIGVVYGDPWLRQADNWLTAKNALEKAARS